MHTAPPRYFWVIGVLMLLWNVLGIAAFAMDATISAEALAEMPAAQRALYEDVPVWATGAYGVAVFSGTLGCVALLLRRRAATPLFAISLAAVIVQMSHAFIVSDTLEVMGPASIAMPIVITVIAVFLIWFSRFSTQREWLRAALP